MTKDSLETDVIYSIQVYSKLTGVTHDLMVVLKWFIVQEILMWSGIGYYQLISQYIVFVSTHKITLLTCEFIHGIFMNFAI